MKKITSSALLLSALIGFIPASTVLAETSTALPTTQITAQPSAFSFTKDFGIGATSDMVRQLQAILNTNLKTQVAQIPLAGSAGHEGRYFGMATRAAVKEFQKLYGITPTGFVGPQTRTILNHLMAGGGPVSLPTIMHFGADKDAKGATVLSVTYTGGGDAPSIWFAFGSSKEAISVMSEKVTGSALGGTNTVTLTGASEPCFAQAYVKNSAGLTKSDVINCGSAR